jgi:hypothetical protein
MLARPLRIRGGAQVRWIWPARSAFRASRDLLGAGAIA